MHTFRYISASAAPSIEFVEIRSGGSGVARQLLDECSEVRALVPGDGQLCSGANGTLFTKISCAIGHAHSVHANRVWLRTQGRNIITWAVPHAGQQNTASGRRGGKRPKELTLLGWLAGARRSGESAGAPCGAALQEERSALAEGPLQSIEQRLASELEFKTGATLLWYAGLGRVNC